MGEYQPEARGGGAAAAVAGAGGVSGWARFSAVGTHKKQSIVVVYCRSFPFYVRFQEEA